MNVKCECDMRDVCTHSRSHLHAECVGGVRVTHTKGSLEDAAPWPILRAAPKSVSLKVRLAGGGWPGTSLAASRMLAGLTLHQHVTNVSVPPAASRALAGLGFRFRALNLNHSMLDTVLQGISVSAH